MKKHRADDDPRRQFLWERAAVRGGPWVALSSVCVSHRRPKYLSEENGRRLISNASPAKSADGGRSGVVASAVVSIRRGGPRELADKCDRARSSDGTLPGVTGGSDRKETLKAPKRGIQSFSRSSGTPSPRAGHGLACELLGCAHALVEFVKHPQRGRLGLCWYHARRVEEIGGRPVGRGHA